MAASSALTLGLAAIAARQSAATDEPSTIRVELTDAATTSDWTDPGVVVPVLAAVVSLLGVLFVNYSSGKRLMRLEERRSIAAASERRMNELRNERREIYAELVAWQRRVENNAHHLVPRRSESWEAWVRRAWPPKHADPSENHTLQELISKALVNGSPFETWHDALKYANHVTATWADAQYCVKSRDEAYFTYLHNIWHSGSSGLPSRISGGIKEDLGITIGPLHILEEIEALKADALMERLDRHRKPFPKTRNSVRWWVKRRLKAAKKARPTRRSPWHPQPSSAPE